MNFVTVKFKNIFQNLDWTVGYWIIDIKCLNVFQSILKYQYYTSADLFKISKINDIKYSFSSTRTQKFVLATLIWFKQYFIAVI